jgi:hypothetical protein
MKEKSLSKSEYKLRIREQAKRKIRGPKYDVSGAAKFREDVAQGLKTLRTVSSEGGDSKSVKVRNEITYLLNNYIPQYDARIEQLIEEWRRSGDPTYDVSIRVRFRTVRREYMGRKGSM